VAAHSKRACCLGAYLVLIDESGVLMAPLVRRTLAPKGQTPFLLHQAKHREKVSLIAALTLSPKHQRLSLYVTSLINASFNQIEVAWFLRQLLGHFRNPLIIVWDRGPMHHGPDIRQLLSEHPRLSLELLPPYAPDLNPVEQLWTHLKWGRLCNFAPSDVQELDARLLSEILAVRNNQDRLRGLWEASELPWPRAFNT
jgi:putative transposase